ncbi:MAG: dTMP kinase [Victivallaceae bacterium]|nr:dTMP kinase [Victivallaceae bacterium]
MKHGVFITFEGPEGSGKSTQVTLLGQKLAAVTGAEPVLTREPGGTPLAEEFRRILKHHPDTDGEPIHPITEILLFEAGRVQNVNCVIKPALAAGRVVICDRFTDSTVAYQGYARKNNIEMLKRLNTFVLDGLTINLTVLLDLPPEAGFARAEKRRSTHGIYDRLEAETIEFHRNVRRGFLELAKESPERFRVFNAEEPPEQLAEEIFREVSRVL